MSLQPPKQPPGPEELVRLLAGLFGKKPTEENRKPRRGIVPAAAPAMRAPVPQHPASRETSMFPKLIIALVV
jgi:hypothetical protein